VQKRTDKSDGDSDTAAESGREKAKEKERERVHARYVSVNMVGDVGRRRETPGGGILIFDMVQVHTGLN
jgi:hypothetical protein